MTLTTGGARDAIYTAILAAWQAVGAASELVPMLYDNVKADLPGEDGSTTDPEPWARSTVRILGSGQSTQGTPRKYLTNGIATVQIFTPIGDGHTLGDTLQQVMLNAFRGNNGSPSTLWFFDVEGVEIGADGPWFQINVSASFNFEEVVT